MDVYLYTEDLECKEHEISITKASQNIQECCRNCLEILCFKQLLEHSYYCYYYDTSGPFYNLYNNVIESERYYCTLCGKLGCIEPT